MIREAAAEFEVARRFGSFALRSPAA